VIIDGTTQPGFDSATGLPRIELNGTGAGNGDGLTISAGSSTVRALAINRFGDDGIEITTNGSNFIQGCFIGTNSIGTATVGNMDSGVVINNTPNNVIGGTTTDRRNLISGNIRGVEISGASATGNQVLGNYIGTDINGTADLGNSNGVFIAAPNNLVGGTVTSSRNVISGSASNVVISGAAATGNQVQGNFIGLNANGTAAVGSNTGVRIENASNNVIGGTASGARNVISGNGFSNVFINANIASGVANNNRVEGNFIGTNALGTAGIASQGGGVDISAFGTASNNVIGGTTPEARNVISGNIQGVGIDVSDFGGTASGNRVEGNFIGTDPAGTAAIPNQNYAVRIDGGTNNVIGGTAAGARNIISGNNLNNATGLLFFGPQTISNRAEGNYIGLDVNGAPLPNARGVGFANGAKNNIVGGTTPAARNFISANTTYGVLFQTAGTTGNRILSNFIGTNVAGTAALPNAEGVRIESGPTGNVIGGPATGNVISGNTTFGVFVRTGGNTLQGNVIGLNAMGRAVVANGDDGIFVENVPNTVIGGTTPGARNIISGNGDHGIRLLGAATTNTIIRGNYIGTDVTGTQDLGNLDNGVFLDGASDNVIGGTTAGAGNVISGNGTGGVVISGPVNGAASSNRIEGNFIGTNAAGTGTLPNSGDGVTITGAPDNVIGGMAPGARNLISGNGSNGVQILGVAATGNQVQGNFIGTDINGTADLGNLDDGVNIQAPGNTVGGTGPGARNVISGNGNGVVISTGATGNQVQGNYIGTDVNGTADLGNTLTGVFIGSTSNLVGGTTAGARNVISGNGTGVQITSDTNQIQGNYIGMNADGTGPLGNTGDGIALTTDADSNTIGGTAVGAGNIIAFNNNGVAVTGTSNGNDILSNSIHSNVLLGIDLDNDGVTPNDSGDADTGANNLQNFPTVTSVNSASGNTTINASLDSTASTSFIVQFFANNTPDSSGYGEGQTFLGQATVTTNGSGTVSFSPTFPVALSSDQTVTATATGPGGTSEFSTNATVVSTGTLQFSTATFSVNESAGTATISVTRTGGSGTDTVPVVVTPGTATRGTDYTVPASGQPAGVAVVNGTPANGDTVTLTFDPGQIVKTFIINISNDSLNEPNETVALALGTPTGSAGTAAPSTATLTINDDDGGGPSGPTLSINNVTVTEGDSGTANATFTVSLTAPSSQTVTVNYSTSDGTAFSPSDYVAKSGTLTFAPNQTTQFISVAVRGDLLNETNEDFFVTLGSPTNATITNNQGKATILNNDAVPSLLIENKTVAEGNSGSFFVHFNVSLSAASAQTVTVSYTTSNGSASAPSDYQTATGTLTFAPGQKLRTISVAINGDRLQEANETFFVDLLDPANATINRGRGICTILNDDAQPPQNRFVVPANSTSPALQTRPFSSRYADDNGAGDIAEVRLMVNASLNPATGFIVRLFNSRLFINNEAGTGFIGGFEPGSTKLDGSDRILINSRGALNVTRTSAVLEGNRITVNWNITPAAAFTGTKNLYLYVQDKTGLVDNYEAMGTWTITPAGSGEAASRAAVTSPVTLSSAAARVESQSVLLNFSGALDGAVAEDLVRYAVTVNGTAVAVERAAYDSKSNMVILELAPGTLKVGDKVGVAWRDLRDTLGRPVAGEAGPLTAR